MREEGGWRSDGMETEREENSRIVSIKRNEGKRGWRLNETKTEEMGRAAE